MPFIIITARLILVQLYLNRIDTNNVVNKYHDCIPEPFKNHYNYKFKKLGSTKVFATKINTTSSVNDFVNKGMVIVLIMLVGLKTE